MLHHFQRLEGSEDVVSHPLGNANQASTIEAIREEVIELPVPMSSEKVSQDLSQSGSEALALNGANDTNSELEKQAKERGDELIREIEKERAQLQAKRRRRAERVSRPRQTAYSR